MNWFLIDLSKLKKNSIRVFFYISSLIKEGKKNLVLSLVAFHICYCFRTEIFHIMRYIGFVFEMWLHWKQWKAKHACIIILYRKSWLNYKISNNKVYYLKVSFICSSVQLYDNPTFCQREVNMLDIVLFTVQISYYFVTWVINLIVNHMCS